MHCPFCAHDSTQVIDTRISEDGACVKRRRQCLACSKRFTTYERPDLSFPAIVKKDGRRVPFRREKLLASLQLALRKRPVSTGQVDALIERLEEKLLTAGVRELTSQCLGEWVMSELQQLDPIAYVRFASVYLSFEDVQEFHALAEKLKP